MNKYLQNKINPKDSTYLMDDYNNENMLDEINEDKINEDKINKDKINENQN